MKKLISLILIAIFISTAAAATGNKEVSTGSTTPETKGSITIDMHDYGNFEKVGPLPSSLPRNDTQITTEPGDIILYQGNQITIY